MSEIDTVQLVVDYGSDDEKRERLYSLFEKVFGIKESLLQDFYARGFWNPSYKPFTLFINDTVIANVSMFSMPMYINNRIVRAAGIQSVMTDPYYRGHGYMKRLMQHMLNEIDQQYEISFLFTGSPGLYRSFGFRELRQHYFTAEIEHKPKGSSLKKVDFFEDIHLIKRVFHEHQPVSKHFSPIAHQSSFYLNLYNPSLQQKLHYIEQHDVLIVFEVEGDVLKLYDVVGKTVPAAADLFYHIPVPFSKVEIYFNPDQLQLNAFKPMAIDTGTCFMARGPFELENEFFILPVTAEF